MTRGEIIEFINATFHDTSLTTIAKMEKIADRWEEDVDDARENGIADGSFAEWSRTSGGASGN